MFWVEEQKKVVYRFGRKFGETGVKCNCFALYISEMVAAFDLLVFVCAPYFVCTKTRDAPCVRNPNSQAFARTLWLFDPFANEGNTKSVPVQ